LGHLYLQQSNYAAARKEFALACQLDPGTGSLHFLLGQAAQHLGLKQEAEAQFAIAARLSLQSARSAQAGREASAKGSN
jgi:Tfp pilus assembly protein PilF